MALTVPGLPCLLWQLPEDTVFPALMSIVMASYYLVGRVSDWRRANDGGHATSTTR